jgi:hypothetical protein
MSISYLRSVFLSFFIFSLSTHCALAEEDFFSDIQLENTNNNDTSKLSVSGFISQSLRYGLRPPPAEFDFERQRAGVARTQADLVLEFEYQLSDSAYLKLDVERETNWLRWENDRQTWGTDDERSFLRDAYFDKKFANEHWLRFGHQLFAWGESEVLPITDVIAPRDLREFLQFELSDLRIQVPALMYSIPAFKGDLSFVTVYDARYNRLAEQDDDFYPFVRVKPLGLDIRRNEPNSRWEYAIKYDVKGNLSDISLVVAQINDNDFSRLLDRESRSLELRQERINVIGLSANRAAGNWLLAFEAANWDRPARHIGEDTHFHEQIRAALKVRYSGLDDWLISYELNNVFYLDSIPSGQTDDDNAPGHVFQLRRIAFNGKLESNLWYISLHGKNGNIYRGDVRYEFSDHLHTTITSVFYESKSSSGLLSPYSNQDSLNISLKILF